MKQKPIIWILLILILACVGFLLKDRLFDKTTDISYSEFIQALENGKIESAKISENSVLFTMKGDPRKYQTDNPGTGDFKERLLLAGVHVQTADDSEKTISFVLDMLFDVIFFGAAGFGLYKLISFLRKTFRVVHKTGVTFDQIAGLDGLKRDMRIIVDVLKNPKKYRDKGLRPIKGIILEGEPGNGKTLFAKALAEEAGVNFIATKGADFQSALMSMGANKIKMLFSKARRNRPCIVFIDEFDSIGERRNYAGSGIDKENNRIITTMLNEMDGFTGSDGVLVIAATNSYQSLDPALIRPGRFDLKYKIGNPDAAARRQLIEFYTKGKTLSADLPAEKLAEMFDGLSCAAIESILNEAAALAAMQNQPALTPALILEAASRTDTKLKKGK